MKRNFFFYMMLTAMTVSGQDYTYRTCYGDAMNPLDTIRVLNIFINIVFDQCETCDTLRDIPTPLWMPGPANTINENPPSYLSNYMDVEFDPGHIRGSFTRRYAQASFNKFIVLGDFTVVNIAESRITPNKPGGAFSDHQLIDSSIALINETGGLRTLYGYDSSITEYDGSYSSGSEFRFKPANCYNDRIDLIQFWVRNCTYKYGSLDGGGKTGMTIFKPLLIKGKYYKADLVTYQGRLGNADLSNPVSQMADVHELAHNLIRNNNAGHMGGGGPPDTGDLATLNFHSGGWSLLGSAGSSLVSCNAFERWYLNWRGPDNDKYPIAAGNESSDVRQSDTVQTFYLRDFVTWGDAIRIRLPYVDSGALNQYIWLENHQIHHNDKEDFPAYWEQECKDDGVPGIYAYYQIGKDIIESNDISDLKPMLTDHLVPVCADGNWDISLSAEKEATCIAGGLSEIQDYYRENPFSGYNDLENHFFDPDTGSVLNWKLHRREMIIKRKNGEVTNKLANMGDNEDPFTGISIMNISSNPAPVNVVTWHHIRPYKSGVIYKSKRTDNRRIHLSGLQIIMTDQHNGTFRMDINWDSYNVTRDVLWAGDIVLHEKVNLMPGKSIFFDQNYSPDKHIRDTVTGLFTGPTLFTCMKNSSFVMQPSSHVILQHLSSFVIEEGGMLEINDSADFIVTRGSTLLVRPGAFIVVNGSGKIEIEKGAYLCIENGAGILLKDSESAINLRPGFLMGKNERVLPGRSEYFSQPAGITNTGKGSVNAYYAEP
jgi:hypothetical protein